MGLRTSQLCNNSVKQEQHAWNFEFAITNMELRSSQLQRVTQMANALSANPYD